MKNCRFGKKRVKIWSRIEKAGAVYNNAQYADEGEPLPRKTAPRDGGECITKVFSLSLSPAVCSICATRERAKDAGEQSACVCWRLRALLALSLYLSHDQGTGLAWIGLSAVLRRRIQTCLRGERARALPPSLFSLSPCSRRSRARSFFGLCLLYYISPCANAELLRALRLLSLSCFFIHMRPAGARVLQRLIAIGCCCSRVPPPRSQGRNFRAPFWSPRARRYAREWVYRYTYCVCIYVCIYYSSSLVTAIFRGISVRADDSRTNRRLFFLGFLLSSRV